MSALDWLHLATIVVLVIAGLVIHERRHRECEDATIMERLAASLTDSSAKLADARRTLREWQQDYGDDLRMIRARRELEARFGEAYRSGYCTCRVDPPGIGFAEPETADPMQASFPPQHTESGYPISAPAKTELPEDPYGGWTCSTCGGWTQP